jgi:tetratricopeptide (TPR) repeat protein
LAAGATPAQGQVGHSGPVSRRSKRAGSRGYPKRFLSRLLRGRLGCLEELPQQQRRVLMLRTGIGGATSHGRRQVARMLRVSLRREGQIERQGVSGIRAGARHGCPALEPGAARALFAAAEAASQVEQLVPAALGTTRSPTARRRHKGTKPRQSVAAATTHVQQGAIPAPSHPSSTTLLWILIATGLFAATAVAGPTARRRARHRLATAPRATAPVPEADEIAAVGAGAAVAARKGSQAERERDIEGALAVYRRADAAGDAQGATNLGVLLEQRGDLDGAAAAYRRADERGDVNGAFNLGLLLAELGDTAGAMAALRRADVRGDAAGASNLGVLLERQGDLDGALAAYRRADERGDPNGSFNLGLLLAARGDLAAARQAYLRACDCGDDQVAQRARAALDDLASD